MSFAIYDLDEDVRKLLTLDKFLDGLTVHEFVEELSKDHILKGAEVKNLEYLDPKPYIRTFESTLRHLKHLSTEAQKELEETEKDVETFELKHSEQVLKLSGEVEEIVSQFDKLDTEISQISNTIDPLNQLLNRITNSRDRSKDTIFLIRSYHGFYTKEKYEPLEKLRTARDTESKMKCARTVKNLLTLAKKIDSMIGNIPKVSKCVTTIEKYSELLERGLVERYEIASEDSDYDEMREIATIMFEFNGGASVVLAYMNKSDIFNEADRTDEDDLGRSILDDEAIWTKLADPNFQAVDLFDDEETQILLDRLKVSIRAQLRVIQQVFEKPILVLKMLVQRVYAQMINNKVSTLLLYSLPHGPLVHVRLLHALYVLVGDFTRELKEYFSLNEYDENNELGVTLDQCYYDLFIDYLSDDTYFRIEKDMLERSIFFLATKFTEFNEKAITKRALEEALQEWESESDSKVQNGLLSSDPSAGEKHIFHFIKRKRLNKFKDFMKMHLPEMSHHNRESADIARRRTEYAEFGEVNITKVQMIIKLAIEAVARVLELAPVKTPEYSLEILEILLLDFGGLYIGGGLEVAFDRAKFELSVATLKPDCDLEYLKVFNLTTEVLRLLSSCIKKIILPCAVNNPAIRNRMISLTNNYVARCETGLNLILATTVELLTEKLNSLLQKQNRKDYLCDDSSMSSTVYTEVCEEVTTLLINVHDTLKTHLNDTNLTNVLIKVGMITLNLLLDHFKKFKVNSNGGLVLTQDVINYQSVIDTWEIEEFSESFQILKEISNLFTVQPNLINSLITEGHLAHLKHNTVKQYISKREDLSPGMLERFFGRK